MRLLIVEDQKQLCSNIAKYMKAEGFAADCCYNGSEALDYLRAAEYDAVILDIMLPGMDGLEVLNKMRSGRNKTPVLLLTARSTVEDKVKGLDSGADDYLTKPFSLEELSARIRVMIRRGGVDRNDTILRAGRFHLIHAARRHQETAKRSD